MRGARGGRAVGDEKLCLRARLRSGWDSAWRGGVRARTLVVCALSRPLSLSLPFFPRCSSSLRIFSRVSFRRRSRIAARCCRRSSSSSSRLPTSCGYSPGGLRPRFRRVDMRACSFARRASMLCDSGIGTISTASSSSSSSSSFTSSDPSRSRSRVTSAAPSSSSDASSAGCFCACFALPFFARADADARSFCMSRMDLLLAGSSYEDGDLSGAVRHRADDAPFRGGPFSRLP